MDPNLVMITGKCIRKPMSWTDSSHVLWTVLVDLPKKSLKYSNHKEHLMIIELNSSYVRIWVPM